MTQKKLFDFKRIKGDKRRLRTFQISAFNFCHLSMFYVNAKFQKIPMLGESLPGRNDDDNDDDKNRDNKK